MLLKTSKDGGVVAIDEQYLRLALKEARRALQKNEVPIGAVAVCGGKVTAKAHNQTISKNDPTAHAEVLALRKAAKAVGNYRLTATTLYVTIEPCAMCVGALLHARIKRLVFGATEPKGGCVVSKVQLLTPGLFNHQIAVTGGVLSEECAAILSGFFQQKRIPAPGA
ncbi:MAG: tRNA adenosine(34) deaminase TadA [Deltaproteobacteria bacterium]|nr:tRNA adenosine(34) deaminase TadA [Deltaproteobacteria bacterium]